MEDIKRQTLILWICNHALSNRFIGDIHLPLTDVKLFGVIMQMRIMSTEEKKEVVKAILYYFVTQIPSNFYAYVCITHG